MPPLEGRCFISMKRATLHRQAFQGAAWHGRYSVPRSFPPVPSANCHLDLQIFLVSVDPIYPQLELPPDPAVYRRCLSESRNRFTTLLFEKMRAPDGSYEDGFIAPGGEKLPARTLQPGNLERNNPLSLHDEVRMPFDRSDEALLGFRPC